MSLTPVPVMDPRFTGHRIESHWTELLDSDDGVVRILDGVKGGSVKQNIDAKIKGGYGFTLEYDLPERWMPSRFRPWVRVNGIDWPLGVYLPSSPDLTRTPGGRSYSVSAHDKLVILDQDKTVETYSLPEGTAVVDTVVGIILSMGETEMAVTESEAVTPTPMTWQVGTDWLTICNDLLRSINYSSLWCDGYGQYRIEPYFEPSEREAVATFRQGEVAIHSGTWSRSQDNASVPNRVVLTTTGSDEVEEMIAIAVNDDPASPYSYQARGGRWITRPYENIDAADQATLNAMAQRYLSNATRAAANLSVSHAVVPLDPGAVVRFISDPIDVIAQVNEFTIPLTPGGLVTAVWSEVERLVLA